VGGGGIWGENFFFWGVLWVRVGGLVAFWGGGGGCFFPASASFLVVPLKTEFFRGRTLEGETGLAPLRVVRSY